MLSLPLSQNKLIWFSFGRFVSHNVHLSSVERAWICYAFIYVCKTRAGLVKQGTKLSMYQYMVIIHISPYGWVQWALLLTHGLWGEFDIFSVAIANRHNSAFCIHRVPITAGLTEVYLTHLHMTSSGNRTPDLLFSSPTSSPLRHMLQLSKTYSSCLVAQTLWVWSPIRLKIR